MDDSSGRKEVETETVMSPVVAVQPFSCSYLQRQHGLVGLKPSLLSAFSLSVT